MSDEKADEVFKQRAGIIAKAFARTSEHHRKTALFAGVIALSGCFLGFTTTATGAKAVALGLAFLFAINCYRSLRKSNSFVDSSASPVLRAIAESPGDIDRIHHDEAMARLSIFVGDEVLDLRIDKDTPVGPLLEALERHAPNAEVQRIAMPNA